MALDVGTIIEIVKAGTGIIREAEQVWSDYQAGKISEEIANARLADINARAQAYVYVPVTPAEG